MNWNIWLGIIVLLVPSFKCDFDMESEEERTELFDTSLLPAILNFTTPRSTIPTTTKDYCHCDMEIYGPEDMKGVLKSPNFPGAHCGSGKCLYKILPHEDMIVRLNVQTSAFSPGTSLKFWHLFYVDGKEYTLFHSRYLDQEGYGSDFNGYKSYTTAKNVGFMVTFEPKKNSYSYKGFKMTFERIANETKAYICDPAVVIVGENETVVSTSRYFMVPSGCSFYLKPSVKAAENQLNEMYIEYEPHLDAYVSVRSYDDQGYFTRDEYDHRNGVRLVDASKVEVLVKRMVSDTGIYGMPNITAKLLKQSCNCPPRFLNLTATESQVTINSPGFPSLYCPGKYCQTTITSPTYDKKDQKALVPLLMVSTNCTLADVDTLRLSSVDTDRVIFRTTSRELSPPKFLRPIILSQQELEVTYQAGQAVRKRYFQMNITRVLVDRDCICTNFEDKLLTHGGFLSVPIPAKCKIIHCHWKFSAGHSYSDNYVSIEFHMSHPTVGDKVYIISETLSEEYNNHLLAHKRTVTSMVSPIEFTFSRFNFTAERDAVLNLIWKITESCTCAAEQFQVEEGKPTVIASPNYPEEYCPNLVCRHTFTAPEGYYLEVQLDDIDLEQFHDFLKIYDGNSTMTRNLASCTGRKDAGNVTSSGNKVYVLFQSDESVGGKGFHANIIAHKMPTKTASVSHWEFFIAISLSICIIAGVAVGFVWFRKSARQVRFQSLTNPTISYASSEIGSQVSIAFSGGSESLQLVNHGSQFETEDV